MQKNTSQDKDQLRKNAYVLRKSIFSNTELHSELSLKIQEYILNTHAYQECEFVCSYASAKGEVSTDYLAEKSFENHKKVLFPLCHTQEEGIMHYALCQSIHDLQQGRYNIPEPKKHCKIIDASILNSQKTLLIVPALAFDKEGFRLGYGQGYYDRFMEKTPHAISMGLAFSDHVFDELPHMEWDKAVNFLVTDQNIVKIN